MTVEKNFCFCFLSMALLETSLGVLVALRCLHVGGRPQIVVTSIVGLSNQLCYFTLGFALIQKRGLALASTPERARLRYLLTLFLRVFYFVVCLVALLFGADIFLPISFYESANLLLISQNVIFDLVMWIVWIHLRNDVRVLRSLLLSGRQPGYIQFIKSHYDAVNYFALHFMALTATTSILTGVIIALIFSTNVTAKAILYPCWHIVQISQGITLYTMIAKIWFTSGPALKAHARELRRKRIHKQSMKAYKQCENAAWQTMVGNLATKGFTLDRLLAFYKVLPTLMPHFNPNTHRTKDVVRAAIIPACADEKCAYAEKMMNHNPTWAKTMVTHCWQNLFRDLVACIVADALGWPYYERVAILLDNNIEELEQALSPEMLSRTYWVCALSVNQHEAICGANPYNDTDPVTGLVFSGCTCGAPKHLNHTPPLRADGKSTACQMNKFDDMMAYMIAFINTLCLKLSHMVTQRSAGQIC